VSVAERYVELCLRLARHDEDLLDYYYGPREIAERVEREPLPDPAELAEEARALAADATPYLQAQLGGLEVVGRKLAGEEIPYEDEVERCYGTRPERAPEEVFERAHAELAEALPAGGSLAERYRRWEDGDPIPTEKLEPVLASVAERLRAAYDFPEGEAYELELVSGKHWYAFNDYRGGLKSRVEVNTDLPISAHEVVALMAHELYPGHHTEQVWKERLLYEQGHLEESVVVYGTPQSVVSEGIAELAVELAVEEHGDSLAEAFAEWEIRYDRETHRRVRHAARPLLLAIGNAALMLHADGVSKTEALEYLRRWGLVSEERAAQHVEFVLDRWGAAYIRTYTDGYDLCRSWVAGDPERFRRLLTEQLTPADLT
jgi:hypothetical protein